MLYRLSIENFYSIREKPVIELIAGKSVIKEDGGRLFPLGPGCDDHAPTVVSFFGPNASGKSNVLRALSFLSWFIVHSFTVAPDNILPFQRFQDATSKNEPTRLAVWFAGPNEPGELGREPNENSARQSCSMYSYEVEFGGPSNAGAVILSESLKYWPRETKRQVSLFRRDDSGRVKAHKSFELSGYQSALEKIIRPNASVISTLAQIKHGISTHLRIAALHVYTNILIEKSELDETVIANLYLQDPQMLNALNEQIGRIDLGIDNVQIASGPSGPFFSISHTGLDRPLNMIFESHGTRQFIKVFPLLFAVLSTGGIALIDELDHAVHPLVMPEILRWFHDKELNSRSAQLWLTSQNASLLEELVKEEIFFCEKDDLGCTSVFGLQQIQSVRRNDNFYRKYLSGAYGAIPRLG